MRFLITFLFAFIATAAAFPQLHFLEARKDGNSTSQNGGKKNGTMKAGNSVHKECKQMNKMMQLTMLAANQTKLDALVSKGKLNATEVQNIKDKAAKADTTLKAMEANTTLVMECNMFNADRKVKAECASMKWLAKTAALAKNTTAMDAIIAKKKLNDTQVTMFKDRIAKAETKLQEMQSNKTLTDLCASQKSQKGGKNGTSSTTGAEASSSSGTPKQSSSASALTLQTLPYVFLPALVGAFTLFL